MAGRKSKTATAAKPKPKAKSGAKSAAKAKSARASSTKAVDKVISAAKGASKFNRKATDVYAELEQLAAYIDAAKSEIAEIRPHDVKEEYLPNATDELDAIVEATADATNAIMDSCEVVESVMGDVSDDVSTTLTDATTRIYEACTFQDITGQRIGKVVTALKNIEERIDALLHTLGDEAVAPAKKKTAKSKAEQKQDITDADLLEGPQLGDKAKSQAEIDDLLASFD